MSDLLILGLYAITGCLVIAFPIAWSQIFRPNLDRATLVAELKTMKDVLNNYAQVIGRLDAELEDLQRHVEIKA